MKKNHSWSCEVGLHERCVNQCQCYCHEGKVSLHDLMFPKEPSFNIMIKEDRIPVLR